MDETNERLAEIRQQHEAQLTESMEKELTDDQLEQLAEGSSSWGANCNNGDSCQ